MSLEKHWDILQNAVNDNRSNSKKEMPSAHRDITKSGILDQVICIRGSEHSEDRASRCDRGGYKGSTEWSAGSQRYARLDFIDGPNFPPIEDDWYFLEFAVFPITASLYFAFIIDRTTSLEFAGSFIQSGITGGVYLFGENTLFYNTIDRVWPFSFKIMFC